MSDSVVQKWLRFLKVEEYSESFIDNGYDDLETVKLIKREDLVAIGVMRKDHQDYLLASVKLLKERGAAWVYLLYCETTYDTEDKFESHNDYCSSDKYFGGSSGPESFKSSIYQQSDETVSEESCSEERKYRLSSLANFYQHMHQGKLYYKITKAYMKGSVLNLFRSIYLKIYPVPKLNNIQINQNQNQKKVKFFTNEMCSYLY